MTERGRQARLRRGSDIRRVLSLGERRRGNRMVLYLLPGEGPTRTAFVCGRRVGGAVVRNRARRLLRAAWQDVSPRVQTGLDVVFVARPEIRGARMQDLVADMTRTLVEAEGRS